VTLSIRQDLEAFYRRYISCCNDHALDRLHEFVAKDVEINGERRGLDGYIDSVEEVVSAFPDFSWDLRRLVIDEPWIAAHLFDHGTHNGRSISTQEFAFYRIDAGKIAEVWGDLRTADLVAGLRK
jgi:predicted ester cyclase